MSAFRPAPESTGLVPDRSFAPVPSAVSVKSATVAVPPLSFTTTLRRCSFGAMSLLVIVQVRALAEADGDLVAVRAVPCVPSDADPGARRVAGRAGRLGERVRVGLRTWPGC